MRFPTQLHAVLAARKSAFTLAAGFFLVPPAMPCETAFSTALSETPFFTAFRTAFSIFLTALVCLLAIVQILRSEDVAGIVPTITFTVPNHNYGDAPFTVSATSNSPGAISYSVISGPATISGSTVTLTATGAVSLQASQAAAGNYSAATKLAGFSVAAIAPTIAFTTVTVIVQ